MTKSSSPVFQNSIRNRFLKTIIGLTIVICVTLVAFFLYVNSINEELKQQREKVQQKATLVAALENSFNSIFFRARGYYAFQDQHELKLLYESLEDFDQQLKKFSTLPLTGEEKTLYDNLVQFHTDYENNILPKAVKYVEQNDYESLRKLSSSGTNTLVNNFVDYAKNYKDKTEKELNKTTINTIEKAQKFTLFALLICALILILISSIMWRVLQNLIRPVEYLTTATKAIADGQPFEIGSFLTRADELGVLSRSFRYMSISIQEKEEVLMAQNEELTAQQTELQTNQDQLQYSLNQLQKYNQLNHSLTFTLDKHQLVSDVHMYLNDLYTFDASLMYLVDSQIFVSKGLSEQTTLQLVNHLDPNKRTRLLEEKAFVIQREVSETEKGISKVFYNCYDLYAPVINSNGKLVAVLMGTREGRSISDVEIDEINGLMNRVSLAFERILMYEQVERSRQLNQDIIDNVNEGIQLVSKKGDVVQVNESLCQIVQCENWLSGNTISKEEWIAHFTTLCTDNNQELNKFFEAAIADQFKDTRKIRYSINHNNTLFIEVYATSVYEKEAKVGTMFVHRDITREYEVDQMKSELVSTVSHELRTPLSSVLGFTELLLTKDLKADRQKKYIETIHKEAKRLTNLINDFLDLQRMEAGKQEYHLQPHAFDEIAIEVVNRFRHEKNHSVHLVDKARLVQVKVDQERIMQVFMNLIGNAIKFSPSGGDVVITLENIEDTLQVQIQDNGIGIPSMDIKELFQKFKRIDNSSRRKIGGTGLGLAISKEIITKHGGDIWIESEEGKGTTVVFTIPLTTTILHEQELLNAEHTGLNVMIVEDDLSLALLLSEELKSKGFTVIHHYHPQRAFEDALHLSLVGIIIDLMLGDEMNGWDLVQKLKETDYTSKIPIIISSALDQSKDQVEKYKIEKYLTKPYPPEELSNILTQFLLSETRHGNVIFPQSEA